MRCPVLSSGAKPQRSRAKAVPTAAPAPKPKRKVVREPKPVVLKITLEPGVSEVLNAMSVSRGVDVQTLVRVALRNLVQRSSFYGTETRLSFGKYRGESMETVIRCDPGYVSWALKTFEGMQLSIPALDLLNEILTAVRVEE